MLLFGCKAHKHYAKQLNHSVDHYSVVIEFAPQGDIVSMKLKLSNGFYHLPSLFQELSDSLPTLSFWEKKTHKQKTKTVPCQEKYRVAVGNPREKEFPSQSLVFSWNL